MSSWRKQLIFEYRWLELAPEDVHESALHRKLADARSSRGLCSWCGEPDPRRRGYCGCDHAREVYEELTVGRIS